MGAPYGVLGRGVAEEEKRCRGAEVQCAEVKTSRSEVSVQEHHHSLHSSTEPTIELERVRYLLEGTIDPTRALFFRNVSL